MNVSEHLEKHLGPIEKGWSSSSAPAGVQVCNFREQPYPSASTCATLGLSNHVLRMREGRDVRQELLLSVHTAQAENGLAGLLLEASARLLREHRALLRGEVLQLGAPVARGTEATALYASIPVIFPEGLATFSETSPPTVVVWLFPILPSEEQFIAAHGWSAFEDLLEQNDPDLLDLHRAPVT